jgi:hypothetical protein
VREGPFEHEGEDFHIPVAVGREAFTRGDKVFINHPQGAEAHPVFVAVVTERKAVMAFQPAVVEVAAVF